jgi:hypothetical protein
MDLHGEIMNINVEKRKQNLAIDDAMKRFKNMKDILVGVYARGHRDARHSAAEISAQQSLQRFGLHAHTHDALCAELVRRGFRVTLERE